MISKEHCIDMSQLLKILAHETRLQMLCFLSEEPKTVGEIEEFCQVSQSTVSQFLARMKNVGLLTAARDGKNIYYAIKDPKVLELLKAMKKVCEKHF